VGGVGVEVGSPEAASDEGVAWPLTGGCGCGCGYGCGCGGVGVSVGEEGATFDWLSLCMSCPSCCLSTSVSRSLYPRYFVRLCF
jgi:hypothetical protein